MAQSLSLRRAAAPTRSSSDVLGGNDSSTNADGSGDDSAKSDGASGDGDMGDHGFGDAAPQSSCSFRFAWTIPAWRARRRRLRRGRSRRRFFAMEKRSWPKASTPRPAQSSPRARGSIPAWARCSRSLIAMTERNVAHRGHVGDDHASRSRRTSSSSDGAG